MTLGTGVESCRFEAKCAIPFIDGGFHNTESLKYTTLCFMRCVSCKTKMQYFCFAGQYSYISFLQAEAIPFFFKFGWEIDSDVTIL